MSKNKSIEKNYYVEKECDGLIHHIVRKADQETIATLDRFSTEIMGYEPYNSIMETITCYYKDYELPVVEYFFGWYFENIVNY